MKNLPLILFILAAMGACTAVDLPERASANMDRACIFAAGSGWTEVDCSAGAAYSAALTHDTRYVVQAVVGAPYLAITTAASGQDADSSDGYLPVGEWLLMATPSATVYLSCDGSADSSKIRYLECR